MLRSVVVVSVVVVGVIFVVVGVVVDVVGIVVVVGVSVGFVFGVSVVGFVVVVVGVFVFVVVFSILCIFVVVVVKHQLPVSFGTPWSEYWEKLVVSSCLWVLVSSDKKDGWILKMLCGWKLTWLRTS